MDPKKDIQIREGQTNSKESIESPILINKNKGFVFVHKRTEKLIAALYMVTGLLCDQEPIKWKVRKLASNVLDSVLELKNLSFDFDMKKFENSVFQIISLLQVSRISGLVSEMNFSILNREFELFLKQVSDFKLESEKVVTFPEGFFNEQSLNEEISANKNLLKDKPSIKGQYNERHENSFNNPISDFKGQSNFEKNNRNSNIVLKKNNRTEIILSLAKKMGKIMIKDVSGEIKDCSEKTIQRELLLLVKNGVLKKEGERRWSKYSLA